MIGNRGSNMMLVVILLFALVIVMVLMELFNAHPQTTIGHTRIYWSGLRHMGFGSDAASVSAFGVNFNAGGSGYNLGPVKFSSVP